MQPRICIYYAQLAAVLGHHVAVFPVVPQPVAALVILAPLLEAGGVRMSPHLAGHAGILAAARLLPRVPRLEHISGAPLSQSFIFTKG